MFFKHRLTPTQTALAPHTGLLLRRWHLCYSLLIGLIFLSCGSDTKVIESVDQIAPRVVRHVPERDAEGVSPRTQIAVEFSEAISPPTLNRTSFLVKHDGSSVDGTVSLSESEATFIPSAALVEEGRYEVSLARHVMDLSGNPMGAAVRWSFQVGDVSSPSVVSVLPPAGATGVSANSHVSVTFSEPSNGVSTSFALWDANNQRVPSFVSPGRGALYSLVPEGWLEAGMVYTAEISTGVTDHSGNHIKKPVVWSFTVNTDKVTPLDVLEVSPSHGASRVERAAIVVVEFSAPVDPETVTANSFLLLATSPTEFRGDPVPGTLTVESQRVSFVPKHRLPDSRGFWVVITTAVEDFTGAPLKQDFQSYFRTVDETAPRVGETIPHPMEVGVEVSTGLVAHFSERVAPATVTTSSFILEDATGNSVPATVGVYEGDQVFLTPEVDLGFDAEYTAVLLTSITDVAGNALGAARRWTFTTASLRVGPTESR